MESGFSAGAGTALIRLAFFRMAGPAAGGMSCWSRMRASRITSSSRDIEAGAYGVVDDLLQVFG